MHITFVAAGSRGDIQPYIALGKGLVEAGHQVRLCTHDLYREWFEPYGIEHAPISGNPREIMDSSSGQTWVESGKNPLQFAREFRRLMKPVMQSALQETWNACQDTDVIGATALSYGACFAVAKKLGKPLVQAYLHPVHPTTAFSSPILPTDLRLGGWFNLLSHAIGGQVFWQSIRSMSNEVIEEVLDMPPFDFAGPFLEMNRLGIPELYGISPSVIPKPRDWPAHATITGYWFLDQADHWTPPPELVAFLESGPPPVYIGFGSMPNRDPDAAARLVIEALERTGQRGLLLSGWKGLGANDLPDTVLRIESAPHDWLFPRMAAVVHHGGAGTTAAGLQAGVPSIVVPFFGDQPFWARLVSDLGVGTRPIPRKKLSADRLAAAIRQATSDTALRERAAALGAKIRAEDGVGCAVDLIEEYILRKE